MSTSPPARRIRLSEIDQRRWGVRTAVGTVASAADACDAVAFCDAEGVELLVARCPADRLETLHALEDAGGRVMDTLVYYACDLGRKAVPDDSGTTTIRPVRPDDAVSVREIAAKTFAGYTGHYHADPRLPKDACDAVYAEWAESSCLDRTVADEVLVSELDGRLLGFATLRLNSDEEGEGVLFGVAPEAQGIGIYRSLMVNGMSWCLEHGRSRMVVSTQVTNVAVQKVWVRVGFEPSTSRYTVHRWSA